MDQCASFTPRSTQPASSPLMRGDVAFRPAVPQDGERIALLMREGVSDAVRRITIMCSPRLARFVTDELAAGTAQEYVVATVNGRVVGTCTWRHTDRSLQLDHLYVTPELRGEGVGMGLLLDGLRRIRRPDEQHLRLDAFHDNPRALAWYRSWKMHREQQIAWLQLPLPSRGGRTVGGTIEGWTEAQARQSRYGFSDFTLSTSRATYRIGRLGEELFRCGTFTIWDDALALEELARLDPRRQLLCVGSAAHIPAAIRRAGLLLAQSERLALSCDAAIEYLESSIARRSHRVRPGSL